MADLFDTLVEGLIGREGGYVNDPKDPGGETIWGITKAVARENGYTGPMRAMTRDQAKAIYRAKYWAKPGLYLIAPLSAAIAEEVFDTGVNMGTGTAGMMLQRALNALNRQGKDYADIKVDGAIGPATTAALKAFLTKRGAKGETVMLKALNCLQGARYIEIAEAREASEAFVFGWLDNRVGLPA
jgi:Putative secretion activating protein